MIKRRFAGLPNFNFQPVSMADVKKIILELKTDKAVSGEISVKLLKDCDFSVHALINCISESIEIGPFHDSIKEASIVPVYKSKIPFYKASCRPVSILPVLFKMYGRLVFNQSSNHTKNFLGQILCG